MRMVFEAEDSDPKRCRVSIDGKVGQVVATLFSAIGWELVTNARDDVTEKELSDYACQLMNCAIHVEVLHKQAKQAKKEGAKTDETNKHIS